MGNVRIFGGLRLGGFGRLLLLLLSWKKFWTAGRGITAETRDDLGLPPSIAKAKAKRKAETIAKWRRIDSQRKFPPKIRKAPEALLAFLLSSIWKGRSSW
jgi:hypothetical protein